MGKHIKKFTKNIQNIVAFGKNTDEILKKIQKLKQSTEKNLKLIYEDRERKIVSLEKREVLMNNFYEKWGRIIGNLDCLRNEMAEIWDL